MEKVQKSTSFIVPMLELDFSYISKRGFMSSYLGDYNGSGDNSGGDYIFLLFSNEYMDFSVVQYLRASIYYENEYDPTLMETMFVFSIPSELKKSVVKPFLNGKYSEISREYVRKHFPPKRGTPEGLTPSPNHMILTRDQILLQSGEERLGVSLPEDAEVWPRPEKEDEVYQYKAEIRETV